MTDFAQYSELSPYRTDPPAMPAGAVGKHGRLVMHFELDSEGRSVMRRLERRTPYIVQRELYFDEAMPEMPCVYILSSGGPQIDGDRYEMEVSIARNAFAHISTGAATKVAEMRHNFAGTTQRFTLGEGAYLEYLPEPLIPCRNARLAMSTRITAAPTATMLYAGILSSGRRHYGAGERFAYDLVMIETTAERPSGTLLAKESMVVKPKERHPAIIGAMEHYDLYANVLLITEPHHAESVYEATPPLSGNGIMAAATRLPNRCGLSYKILGSDTEPVKRAVRAFADTVRREVKGRPLPDEFPWR